MENKIHVNCGDVEERRYSIFYLPDGYRLLENGEYIHPTTDLYTRDGGRSWRKVKRGGKFKEGDHYPMMRPV